MLTNFSDTCGVLYIHICREAQHLRLWIDLEYIVKSSHRTISLLDILLCSIPHKYDDISPLALFVARLICLLEGDRVGVVHRFCGDGLVSE